VSTESPSAAPTTDQPTTSPTTGLPTISPTPLPVNCQSKFIANLSAHFLLHYKSNASINRWLWDLLVIQVYEGNPFIFIIYVLQCEYAMKKVSMPMLNHLKCFVLDMSNVFFTMFQIYAVATYIIYIWIYICDIHMNNFLGSLMMFPFNKYLMRNLNWRTMPLLYMR
jgi:hypothetical protein